MATQQEQEEEKSKNYTSSLQLVDVHTGRLLTEMHTEEKVVSLAKVRKGDLLCVGYASDHFSSDQRSKKKSKLGKGMLQVLKVQRHSQTKAYRFLSVSNQSAFPAPV